MICWEFDENFLSSLLNIDKLAREQRNARDDTLHGNCLYSLHFRSFRAIRASFAIHAVNVLGANRDGIAGFANEINTFTNTLPYSPIPNVFWLLQMHPKLHIQPAVNTIQIRNRRMCFFFISTPPFSLLQVAYSARCKYDIILGKIYGKIIRNVRKS